LDRPRDPGSRDRARGARSRRRARPAAGAALARRRRRDSDQPGGIEQLEDRVRPPEDRGSDELAAHQAEHVAVTRVAGSDPDAVAAGDSTHKWQEVLREAEDPGP